jgi:hypothetical protein
MRYFLTYGVVLISLISFSQSSHFNSKNNWKMNRKELMIQAGATQFLGDLGGRDQIGTDYSLVDIDFPSTSLNVAVGYRYRFAPHFATSSLLNIGRLRGSDALTADPDRNARNLAFRSPVVNLSQRMEWLVFVNEKYGKRYNIKGLKGFGEHHDQIYLFAGIGATYFNPQAPYKGGWENLRPLKTEGQGLEGGAKAYLPITATVPIGIGYRRALVGMWRIGIEATYVKTFSDYIDDVHGFYYDPAILASEVSATSAALSNPSVTNPEWFGPGSKRGEPQKDAYFYLNITFYKNFTYKPIRKMYVPRYKGGRAKF